MEINEIMKSNDICLDWLFTLAKLNDKEGLMYFEPVVSTVSETEVTDLVPKCFIIDGAKFIYDDEMDRNITVHSLNDIITFTRIDGVQLNINTKTINGFPFNTSQFRNKVFETQCPTDHVQVE